MEEEEKEKADELMKKEWELIQQKKQPVLQIVQTKDKKDDLGDVISGSKDHGILGNTNNNSAGMNKLPWSEEDPT